MSLIELGVLTVNIPKIVGLNKEIKESKKELESLKIELERQKEKIKRKENIEKNYKNNNLYVRVYPYSQKEKSKTLILKK